MFRDQIRVAVIDDEKDILDMIERYLNREGGYFVQTFQNPTLALESISDNVDVVLLDIMMPQMNGLDVLAQLKKRKIKTKVIMMTAYSTLDKVLTSHREGATDFIMKPFESLRALSDKIKEVLAQ